MEGNLNIRGIDPALVLEIKASAAARGMTLGQYVGALARLHTACRGLADTHYQGQGPLKAELVGLGLETVSH